MMAGSVDLRSARFLSKALMYDISEEKFILLWTALEVFPMKDTSNIKPISTYLGKMLNTEATIIKEKLSIGRLYGLRCSLVHQGKFVLDETISSAYNDPTNKRHGKYQQSDTIARLEYIGLFEKSCGGASSPETLKPITPEKSRIRSFRGTFTTQKLREPYIVREIMRYMCGLPYYSGK